MSKQARYLHERSECLFVNAIIPELNEKAYDCHACVTGRTAAKK